MKDDLRNMAARRKMARIEAKLREFTMTTAELAKAVHSDLDHLRRYIMILRGEYDDRPKKIFIASWEWSGTKRPRRVPAFRWMVNGDEQDAPKPPNLTVRERTERQIARRKSDEDLNRHVNTLRRIRYHTRRGTLSHAMPMDFFRPKP